jgi:AraC family transcriptional regulator of adaptative response / DNA-3-methyladenine glycosylase II
VIALQTLARAVVEEGLILARDADRDLVVSRLLQLPGVGPWTASYIAMRALGDPDAFPASDLGIRHAFKQEGEAVNVRSIERRAESWRPWRAYAAHYLWASLPPPQPYKRTAQQKRSCSSLPDSSSEVELGSGS